MEAVQVSSAALASIPGPCAGSSEVMSMKLSVAASNDFSKRDQDWGKGGARRAVTQQRGARFQLVRAVARELVNMDGSSEVNGTKVGGALKIAAKSLDVQLLSTSSPCPGAVTTAQPGRNRFGQRCVASAAPIVHEPASGVSFIRPHLRELAPYTPIVPFEILSAQLGRSPKDIVKLDANENPYGPPPEVMEALGRMEFPHIYPDPESRRLRAALAEESGLGAEHILVGCGADELIDLIMRCTLDPGDSILDFPPTFTMYAFDAAVNGANVIQVPRLMDFSLDIPKILDAVQRYCPKLIFVTSPNNPDGSLINEQHLLELLKLPVLVVLDEAYIEFASEPSRMHWVKMFDNLIVLRTFSKRAGLAGIRVGYGAFPLNIIEFLWRAKQPYNVSAAAEVAACAALTNPEYLEEVKVALVNEREKLFKLLQDVPFLTPYPSNSNFVLCSVNASRSAKQLKGDLAKEGVIVRHYDNKELRNYIRISVGRPEHTDAFFAALAKVS